MHECVCVGYACRAAAVLGSLLEQFNHFNLVFKRPLCLYLLEFPVNGIFLQFERCLGALDFIKYHRA